MKTHENISFFLVVFFKKRTWMNVFLSGGHEQGILTTCPLGPLIPSQSPVPVGFTPDWTPNCGMRDESMEALLILVLLFGGMGIPVTERMMDENERKITLNFIFFFFSIRFDSGLRLD
jgi:hypothetical protein